MTDGQLDVLLVKLCKALGMKFHKKFTRATQDYAQSIKSSVDNRWSNGYSNESSLIPHWDERIEELVRRGHEGIPLWSSPLPGDCVRDLS